MNRKNKLTITVLLAVLATVLLAAGCGPTPTPTLPGESLEWGKIAQYASGKSDYTYEDRPRVTIITNQEEMTILEGQVYPEVLDRVLSTDFSTHFVVAIFQGEKATTGYSVEVVDVRLEGNVITIYAEFLTPPTPAPGQIVGVGPMVTSPYYVLRVKKTPELGGDFIFVLIANGEEIMRQDQFIS